MTILPVVSGLVLSLARPDYLSPLFNESRGQNMLVFGVVSLVLGIVTMRQLIRGATRD